MVAVTKSNNFKFDLKEAEKILRKENAFIKQLFSVLPIPTSALQGQIEDEEEEEVPKKFVKLNGTNEKSRAQSLTELQERLKNIQSKKKLNYKDKLLKKGLKNRLKKKTKLEERHMKKKLVQVAKIKGQELQKDVNEETKTGKPTAPVFNKEGKMVFSKFDFSGLGHKVEKRTEKDPKKILKNLEKQKQKLNELEEKGEKEKAKELKEKQAWKAALAKAEGAKIKDDPLLLKKSIKKRDQQHKSSQNKWKNRIEGVQKAKEAKQTKRTENLEKRKKERKVKKLKKAAKKGKIIPGF